MALKSEIDQLLRSTYEDLDSRPALFAVDLGGTKISYGLFPFSAIDALEEKPIFTGQTKTIRGSKQIALSLQLCFKDAIEQAQAQRFHVLPAISIGSPGRFIGDNHHIIAAKTAANLEQSPGEFDNFPFRDFLAEYFPPYVTITVKNDALSQMSAGLNTLLHCAQTRELLLNQTIAYIGPGTGLGGGFCTVDNHGQAEFFSDGHIIDNPVKDKSGNIRGAEDIFSGRAFSALTGKTAKAVNSDPELFAKYLDDVKLMGYYLAQIIRGIYNGELEKVDPAARWPEVDIQKAAGTRVFLIGGSMGTRGKMGDVIQETARQKLVDIGLKDIKIIPIPNAQGAALYGTAQFLSSAELAKAADTVKTLRDTATAKP